METKFEVKKIDIIKDRMAKKSGGKAFLVPKLGIQRIKDSWSKMKGKLSDYAKEGVEAKKAELAGEIRDWVKDRDALKRMANKDPEDKEVQTALSYSKQQITKLRAKKTKINKRGLGVFALSKIAVKKLTSDAINKTQEKISSVKEKVAAGMDSVKQNYQELKQDLLEAKIVYQAEKQRAKDEKELASINASKASYESILQNILLEMQQLNERAANIESRLGVANAIGPSNDGVSLNSK